MNLSTIDWLHCQFFGGKLKPRANDRNMEKLEYGVLTCNCGQFPVVAGIPILKKDIAGTTNAVIAMIESGRYFESLLEMVTPSSLPLISTPNRFLPRKVVQLLNIGSYKIMRRKFREKAAILLKDGRGGATASNIFDFYFNFTGQKEVLNYFVYRFGQPRHLVALSLVNIMKAPKMLILDLACGCGHITRSLIQRSGDQLVIGIDEFFFGLYMAKHWIAPEAEYICCSAETSLPVADDAFSIAHCADTFHYFQNKLLSICELRRITQSDGTIILSWVHNAFFRRPADGSPLSPQQYQTLMADIPHCMVSDNDVLDRYLNMKGAPLAIPIDNNRLQQAPLLSIVASQNTQIFRNYGTFNEWPHASGVWRLNLLYIEDGRDESGNVTLRRTFPSTFYEQDHEECKKYLPVTVKIGVGVLDVECPPNFGPELC